MKCVFTDSSAAEFLRAQRLNALATLVRATSCSLSDASASSEVLDRKVREAVGAGRSIIGTVSEPLSTLGYLGIEGRPVHLLVGKSEDRRSNALVTSHVCESTLPSGALMRIDDGLYSISPELSFVQMADGLELPDLVMLGYELCGSYALDPTSMRGFVEAEPMTSVARLRRFIGMLPQMRGCKKARTAARYIEDGSASPRESALCALLTLDPRYGGYGLPAPQLNVRIDIPRRAREYDSRNYLVADLYWEDFKLDIEYDSDAYHLGERQRGRDASRANVLRKLGIQLISITNSQMKNQDEFDCAILSIRDVMGLRRRRVSSDVAYKRDALRRQLIMPTYRTDDYFKAEGDANAKEPVAMYDEWLDTP